MDKLTGQIVLKKSISGTIQQKAGVTGTISYPKVVHEILPWYDDTEYTVIPKINEQILPTKNKSMREDLTIEAIPYAVVSNPSGGKTVTIGFE